MVNGARRVVLLEINEISWELMKPWLDAGELPNFQRLRNEGTFAETHTEEQGHLLNPWVTWITVYTGVPHTEHKAEFLEQPPETYAARRVWDFVHEAGKKVGVFGSISSWPPRAVNGFYVPGSFSPQSDTHPPELRPIQELNLRYTRAHAPGVSQPGIKAMLQSGLRLVKFGLGPSVVANVVRTMVSTKLHPESSWKKVALQPAVNFAFFRKLFRKTRPDFATFHTNHVAHYQHRFLRALRPDSFPDATDPEEIRRFGDAIHYGYQTADRLLGQFIRLCQDDRDVVLCVASSMGQVPNLPERYGNVAPPTCRLSSIDRLVRILGIQGRCEYFSTMAPQWNIRIPDAELRQRVVHDLHKARYQPLNKSMYDVLEVKDSVVLTPVSHHGLGETAACSFPTLPGTPTFPFDELVIQADETRKSGTHDPIGMLAFIGPGIRRGQYLGQVSTLDIAPTVLSMLDVPVPLHMKGRVLHELSSEARPELSAAGHH